MAAFRKPAFEDSAKFDADDTTSASAGGGSDAEFAMPSQSKDHLFFSLGLADGDGDGGGGRRGGGMTLAKQRKRAYTAEQRRALDEREAERIASAKQRAAEERTRDLVIRGYASVAFHDDATARGLDAGKQLLRWNGVGGPKPAADSTGADGSSRTDDGGGDAVDDASIPLTIDRYDVRALLTEYDTFARRPHFATTQHLQYVWTEECGRTDSDRKSVGRDDGLEIEEDGRANMSSETDAERDARWERKRALLDTVLDHERYIDLPIDEAGNDAPPVAATAAAATADVPNASNEWFDDADNDTKHENGGGVRPSKRVKSEFGFSYDSAAPQPTSSAGAAGSGAAVAAGVKYAGVHPSRLAQLERAGLIGPAASAAATATATTATVSVAATATTAGAAVMTAATTAAPAALNDPLPPPPLSIPAVDPAKKFVPTFEIPDHLIRPRTSVDAERIAKTARFVVENGAQAEIILKVKQSNNPAFAFLLPNTPLHAYYQWIKSQPNQLIAPPPTPSSTGSTATAAVSTRTTPLVNSGAAVAASSPRSVNTPSPSPITTAAGTGGGGNTAASAEAVVGLVSGYDSDPETAPPAAAATAATAATATTATAAAPPSLPWLSSSALPSSVLLSSSVSSSLGAPAVMLPLPPSPIPIPTHDMRLAVQKLVPFVLKNGAAFEAMMRTREANNPRFAFLQPNTHFHAYYVWATQHIARTLAEAKQQQTVAATPVAATPAAAAAATTAAPAATALIAEQIARTKNRLAVAATATAIPLAAAAAVVSAPPGIRKAANHTAAAPVPPPAATTATPPPPLPPPPPPTAESEGDAALRREREARLLAWKQTKQLVQPAPQPPPAAALPLRRVPPPPPPLPPNRQVGS